MSAPLTVVIITLNEEQNITHALRSVVGWASKVCVVDSLSRDRTVEICTSLDGVYVARHRFEDYGKQWNWALDHLPIETEWVMKLDADEVVTPALRDEIAAGLSTAPADVTAFALWRKFMFMGKWLKHMVGRCYDVRIWRTGMGRFEERQVNEHLIVDGDVRRLRAPLVHEDRKGISAWVWRHNRYSTMEAREHFRGAACHAPKVSDRGIARRHLLRRRVWPRVPFKPLVHFLHLMILRLGFLDGRAGWTYARLRCFYHYLIEVKKRERTLTGEVSSQEVMY